MKEEDLRPAPVASAKQLPALPMIKTELDKVAIALQEFVDAKKLAKSKSGEIEFFKKDPEVSIAQLFINKIDTIHEGSVANNFIQLIGLIEATTFKFLLNSTKTISDMLTANKKPALKDFYPAHNTKLSAIILRSMQEKPLPINILGKSPFSSLLLDCHQKLLRSYLKIALSHTVKYSAEEIKSSKTLSTYTTQSMQKDHFDGSIAKDLPRQLITLNSEKLEFSEGADIEAICQEKLEAFTGDKLSTAGGKADTLFKYGHQGIFAIVATEAMRTLNLTTFSEALTQIDPGAVRGKLNWAKAADGTIKGQVSIDILSATMLTVNKSVMPITLFMHHRDHSLLQFPEITADCEKLIARARDEKLAWEGGELLPLISVTGEITLKADPKKAGNYYLAFTNLVITYHSPELLPESAPALNLKANKVIAQLPFDEAPSKGISPMGI